MNHFRALLLAVTILVFGSPAHAQLHNKLDGSLVQTHFNISGLTGNIYTDGVVTSHGEAVTGNGSFSGNLGVSGAISVTGAVNAGSIGSTASISAGTGVTAKLGSGNGSAVLFTGDTSHSGYVQFYDPAAAYVGYLGYGTTGGALPLVSVNGQGFAFSGGPVTIAGSLSTTGTTYFSGDSNFYAAKISGLPIIQMDPQASLSFDRTAQAFNFGIGNTLRAAVNSAGLYLPGTLNLGGGATVGGGLSVTGTAAVTSLTGDVSAATSLATYSSASARSLAARASDVIKVADFCASVSGWNLGTADTTACQQAAATAACTVTATHPTAGGKVEFPDGRFLTNGTVYWPCGGLYVYGTPDTYGDYNTPLASHGNGTQIISGHRTDQNQMWLFALYSYPASRGSPPWQGGPSIENISFGNPTTGSSSAYGRTGPLVEIDYAQGSHLNNLYFWGVCRGLKISGGLQYEVENTHFDSYDASCPVVTLYGHNINGTGNQQTTLDIVSFDHVYIAALGAGSDCYSISDRVQTVYWKNTQCDTGGDAIHYTCPDETSLLYCGAWFVAYDFEAEQQATGAGLPNQSLIYAEDMAGWLHLNDSFLRGAEATNSGQSANLVQVKDNRFTGTGAHTAILGGWYKYAGQDAINFQNSAGRDSVIGAHIYAASKNSGGYAAVHVANSAGRTIVANNEFCQADFFDGGGVASTDMVGVKLDSGSSDSKVHDNITADCSGAGVVNNSGNATNDIHDN